MCNTSLESCPEKHDAMTGKTGGPDIVGIITARGGSRSVPKKNIAPVGGKPLIAWTIEAALQSRALDYVMVSTDDDEIADVARRYGVDVPFTRPAELARDDSSQIAVITHAMQWLESQQSWKPEYVMLLQPTSPLRTTEDIQAAVDLALAKQGDSVVSVCSARHHPYIIVKITEDGTLADFMGGTPQYLDRRRQECPPAYALNGAIFLTRRRILLDQHTFYPARTFAYVMPPERSLDIDDPWDLHVANVMMGYRHAAADR